MSIDQLAETAQAMVAAGKGIIAIDESNATIQKRFDGVGIECTEENRRAYREMLLTTPKLGEYISGAILYDETLRQKTKAGVPFTKVMMDNGILPGIKVDMGAKPLAGFPGELVTEGLDGLRDRLKEYAKLGAKFAKWRAVITIGEDMPSGTCIEANCHALARYAARSNGYVPARAQIYDWSSLRQVVNLYGEKPLPATETDAGFRFLRYRTDSGRGDYTLLVELVQPQDGLNRVEITPYGVDRAN